MSEDVAHWTRTAEDWIRWVRTDNHDAFWAYQTALEGFVGRGSGTAIDIGCGEGRVARMLQRLGYHLTAVEPVPAFLEAARAADSASVYVEAPAQAVPLPSGAFDLAIMYNMLMDVDDLSGALSEAFRLTRSGGRLIIGVVHPFADLMLSHRRTGAWEGMGGYWDPRPFSDETEQDGLNMHFRGWMRPLSAYTQGLTSAGFALSRIHEPHPEPKHPWTQRSDRWTKLPLFLWIEAVRPVAIAQSPVFNDTQ